MSDPKHEDTIAADTIYEDLNAPNGMTAFAATKVSLGIIWHQDIRRIGGIAPLHFDRNDTAELSRITPEFQDHKKPDRAPLLDRHLSRTPVKIKQLEPRKFSFSSDKPLVIAVNGRTIKDGEIFDMDELGDEIIINLADAILLSLFNAPARQASISEHGNFGLIGISNAMSVTRDAIRRIAQTDIPVLVRGETGTGKELVARGLHQASARTDRPLVTINMATIAASLAGLELFGAKRGAFTGAVESSSGLFEQAEGGVLFLDEIGDTPREVQPMLLRALEQKEIKRIGDDKLRKIDVRFIAATDRSLEFDPDEPSFNQPLLRRLEGASILIPPLRFRRVDIGVLLAHFFEDQSFDGTSIKLADMTISQLENFALHDWPGNVRELRNSLQRLMLGQKTYDHRSSFAGNSKQSARAIKSGQPAKNFSSPAEISDEALIEALNSCNWVIKDTAEKLGLSRTSLYAVMAKSREVRDISDISDEEIIETTRSFSGLNDWVKHLRVGREALRKRVMALKSNER